MGKKQCCKEEVRREAWTDQEDKLLRGYISTHGEGKWRSVPVKAGHLIISDSLYRLRRCGRSCSLRWFNYLKPGIKRANITLEEEDLIIELHSKFGNRWSAIAARLAGRMDNEIKNYWNTVLKRKILSNGSKLQKTSEKKRAVTGHKFNANSCDAITLMDDSSSDKVTTGLFKFWERVLQHLEVDPGSSHTCSTTSTSHKVSRKTSSTTNSKDESNWIVNEVRENEDIRV